MCAMDNSPPTDAHPTLLTVPEAAAVLNMSASTLYRWSCTGRNRSIFVRIRGGGTGVRPGLRVHPDRLADFIASGTRP